MALTAAVAVVLSLRQGAMVAVLGLVGGFVTPQLVQAGEPDPRLLFVYLLLLQAGLLAVARKKDWPGLAAVGYCGGLAWLGALVDKHIRTGALPLVGPLCNGVGGDCSLGRAWAVTMRRPGLLRRVPAGCPGWLSSAV